MSITNIEEAKNKGYEESVEFLRHLGCITKAQARLLTEIRADGVREYDGRSLKALKALERLGTVKLEHKIMVLNGGQPRPLIVAHAVKDAGRRNREEREAMGRMYDAIDEALYTFQWSHDRGNNLGEVELDREEGWLRLVVYVLDSDNPDVEHSHGLIVSQEVDPYTDAKKQIRRLIHFHICHEADERLWFDNERPFYPHDEDGNLIND